MGAGGSQGAKLLRHAQHPQEKGSAPGPGRHYHALPHHPKQRTTQLAASHHEGTLRASRGCPRCIPAPRAGCEAGLHLHFAPCCGGPVPPAHLGPWRGVTHPESALPPLTTRHGTSRGCCGRVGSPLHTHRAVPRRLHRGGLTRPTTGGHGSLGTAQPLKPRTREWPLTTPP